MTGLIILFIGVELWTLSHFFKRLMPAQRAAMGDKAKGMVTIASFAAIGLMVLGYHWADFIPVWDSPRFLTHINNLLMLIALYLFAVSGMKTRLSRTLRHPMLLGTILWAVAHLLVNGDVASIILFGGMAAWAVGSIVLINRDGPRGALPVPAPMGKEIGAALGAVIVMVVIGMIHGWLGPWPFG